VGGGGEQDFSCLSDLRGGQWERRGWGECHTLLLCGSVNRRVPRVSSRLPRLLSNSKKGPAAMRIGSLGPLMRGVLFLIKDGQAIITIIITSCTMEHVSLSYRCKNPPTGLQQWLQRGEDGIKKQTPKSQCMCQFIVTNQHV